MKDNSSAIALIVDDDAALRSLVGQDLEDLGLRVIEASGSEAALEVLRTQDVDLVITDVRMSGRSGTWLCGELTTHHPHLPVIVMTGYGTLSVAIEALRAGAYDFLSKPFKAVQLEASVLRALETTRLRRELRQLRRALEGRGGYGDLIGQSAAMQRVFDLIDRVSASNARVLISGESGVGKELVARAIHQRSRPEGAFVAANCAAIPESLVESELFGHERGAFSSAARARPGLFRQANGGVLFLDEIGELPLNAQPKLLRALQERRVRPVGADQEVSFDARVLAATHRDLSLAVEEGAFRSDLYYRLAVIVMEIPPLRARQDDILLLVDHFLEEITEREGAAPSELGQGVAPRLLSHAWPGNVRELQNAIEHAFMMSQGRGMIEVEHLPASLQSLSPGNTAPPPLASSVPSTSPALESLSAVEHRHIVRVLDAVDGNKSQAAKILGIDRKTLRLKLKRYPSGR